MDRHFKQYLLRDEACASYAICSLIHLSKLHHSLSSVFSVEVSQGLSRPGALLQYHASLYVSQFRENDPIALIKLVHDVLRISNHIFTNLNQLQLIRFLSQNHINEVRLRLEISDLVALLSSSGRKDILVTQILLALSFFPEKYEQASTTIIPIIKKTLTSGTICSKYEILKSLATLILRKVDISSLIPSLSRVVESKNLAISKLAIVILLKIGDLDCIGNLIQLLPGLISETTEPFKVSLLSSLLDICYRYPDQAYRLVNFFSKTLRSDGSEFFKTSCIDAIFKLVDRNIVFTKDIIETLCEFIEDSESSALKIRILKWISDRVSDINTDDILLYTVRCICNRLILEERLVRIAAIDCLIIMSVELENFRDLIKEFIVNFIQSDSDELLVSHTELLLRIAIDDPDAFQTKGICYIFCLDKFFESSVLIKFVDDSLSHNAPFSANLNNIPLASSSASINHHTLPALIEIDNCKESYTNHSSIKSIPDSENLGTVFASSAPSLITEKECEYQVSLIKHIYDQTTIFEFIINNTLTNQVLKDVRIDLKLNPSLKIDKVIKADIILPKEVSSVYVFIKNEASLLQQFQVFSALNFTSFLPDKNSSFPEKYVLGNAEMSFKDYVIPKNIECKDLCVQTKESFTLTALSTIEEAVHELCEMIGGLALLKIDESSSKIQELFLSGLIFPKRPFVAKFALRLISAGDIALDAEVYSNDADTGTLLIGLIA